MSTQPVSLENQLREAARSAVAVQKDLDQYFESEIDLNVRLQNILSQVPGRESIVGPPRRMAVRSFEMKGHGQLHTYEEKQAQWKVRLLNVGHQARYGERTSNQFEYNLQIQQTPVNPLNSESK